ncbi:MAG: DHA2 family efflux MFS transporter permease subunit [Alphaproteobacteria bacterium]
MNYLTMTSGRRWAITVSIMLAAMMNTLDTTIANVALPHIQGSVGASQEQITWVLTSYLIAAAVMTPLTSWCAERFGRKELFLISIGGFTAASLLCGIATSLPEIVLFRLFQGLSGAALLPLSQAVLLDINPPENHGQAMSIWGAGAVLGPVLGPVMGGWLTDNWSWRWVFLINLPVGVLAFIGVMFFMSEERHKNPRPFDFQGFATLTLAIACLQLMADRGPTKDWLGSPEIWAYIILCGLGLYWFIIHTLTTNKRPFFNPEMFADRNFLTCTVIGFMIGLLLYGSMALLPPLMENLLGYPVLTTGLVQMPRGIGMLISMLFIGQLVNRIDVRLLVLGGLALNAVSAWQMAHFNLQMSTGPLVISAFLQGLGTAMIFVPLSTMAFATLSPALRTEGAAFYTLMRNIGSAIGISIIQAIHVDSIQTAHARLVEHLRPDNPLVQSSGVDLATTAGQLMANGMAERQAAMLAYVNDFYIMLAVAVLIAPLMLFVRTPSAARAARAGNIASAAVE